MAEIYKLKKGSNSWLTLRYAGNASDNFAKVMAQSNNIVYITSNNQTAWEDDNGLPFPEPPHDFKVEYDNDQDFSDFINDIIYSYFDRDPQNGDVIRFDNYGSVFVFSDSNIVWTVKKGNQEVYSVKKGGEIVFQRQYLRGYENASLSSFVNSTITSITWRITNKDPDLAADTYAIVTEGSIPGRSLVFSSGYKRGTLIEPLSNNTFTTSNLNDGSKFYCRAGLKHPTLEIMPITGNYLSYNLPVAAPSVQLIAKTENSATIRFTNNISTKTIEIFARVGTSYSSPTTQGTIAPGEYKDVLFSGLTPDTTYNLYYYARYVIQDYSPSTPGTWTAVSEHTLGRPSIEPIVIGGSCSVESGLAYYSTETNVTAECIGYEPGVPLVYGYLPGPNSSNYYTSSNYFKTNSPPAATKWTYWGSIGSYDLTFDRGSLTTCDTAESGAYNWLYSKGYYPSNYALGTVARVTSRATSPCMDRLFKAE